MDIPKEILEVAKETMRRTGGHPPTVFLRGTTGSVFMRLPLGESHTERVAIMTEAGMHTAQYRRVGEAQQVILVCEGWMSPARADYVRPSADPNRMEVLLVTALDAHANTQTFHAYACIRDRKQRVIELEPVGLPEGGSVRSPLLPQFLSAYRVFSP